MQFRSYQERNNTTVAQAGMTDSDLIINFNSGVGSRVRILAIE